MRYPSPAAGKDIQQPTQAAPQQGEHGQWQEVQQPQDENGQQAREAGEHERKNELAAQCGQNLGKTRV